MHSKNKILLVEDESSLSNLVVKYLSDNSYICTHVSRLKRARELLKKIVIILSY